MVYRQCWIFFNWTLMNKLQEIFIKIQRFSFTKMHLEISSAKRRSFCPGGNELTTTGAGWMLIVVPCSVCSDVPHGEDQIGTLNIYLQVGWLYHKLKPHTVREAPSVGYQYIRRCQAIGRNNDETRILSDFFRSRFWIILGDQTCFEIHRDTAGIYSR